MLNFAGVPLPSFVKVTGMKYMILPNVDVQTAKIYGRPGVYDFGIELGYRMIEAEIKIIGANETDVIKKTRLLADWLFHKDLQPLIINDEPDKQYMARIDGQTDINEVFRIGEATLKFIVPSPFAESTTEKEVIVSPTDETPFQVTNGGNYETFPVINLNIKKDATSIAVVADEKFVQIGGSDVTKTNTPVNPLILRDTLDSYSGWTNGIAIDGGNVAGSFTSNGYSISQTGKDYGTGTGWHGAAAIKSLSKELQDFTVQANIGLIEQNNQQVGRVEIYLLDVNNVHIGKVALVDSHVGMAAPRFEARSGALSGGKYFINDFGATKGVFKQFNGGLIRIWRHGNLWGAYIAKIRPDGSHHTRIDRYYADTRNLYTTKKLAKIQVHIGTYGTYQPVNNMYISDLKVWEKTMNVNRGTVNPVIFEAGDIVTIDNDKAIVLKNGEPIFQELEPSSDFFSLKEGVNGLILSPGDVADVSVKYRERWL